MRTIVFQGREFTCPFTDHFRRHTPDELADMRASVKAGGILNPIRVYDDTDTGIPDCVLDGEGRLETAAALGDEFVWGLPLEEMGELGTDEAYELAKVLNDHRRQDDPAAVRQRREERVRRVAVRRSDGESLRTIAEKEGVSESQVREDLKKATAQGCAVEPERVKGRDGRTRTATPKRSPQTEPEAPPEHDADPEPDDGCTADVPCAPPVSPPQPAPAPAGKPGYVEPTRDQLGREVPHYLVPIFEKRSAVRGVSALIGKAASGIEALDKDEEIGGFARTRPQLRTDLGGVSDWLRTRLAPYCVCPACDGDGDKGICPSCGGCGWLSKAGFRLLAEVMQEKARSFRPGDAWEPPDDPTPPECCDTAPDPERRFAAPGVDAAGRPIPKHLRDLFQPDFLVDAIHGLKKLEATLQDAKAWLHWLKPEALAAAAQLARYLDDAIPHEVCRHCGGKTGGCGACMTSGYLPRWACEAGQNEPAGKPGKASGKAPAEKPKGKPTPPKKGKGAA